MNALLSNGQNEDLLGGNSIHHKIGGINTFSASHVDVMCTTSARDKHVVGIACDGVEWPYVASERGGRSLTCISSVGSERRGWVMEVSDGFYGGGEGAIDETADVPATGGLYDSLLITTQ